MPIKFKVIVYKSVQQLIVEFYREQGGSMKKLILSLLLLAISSHTSADVIATLENGKKAILKDNGTWSYVISSKEKASDTYKDIKLMDLKSDIDSFNGNKIKIQALAEMYNFILMLREDKMDAAPLSVNINNLSQKERKRLRADCNNGCTVTVYGRVGDVMHDERGIIADKIEW